jgi:hypothetical protein
MPVGIGADQLSVDGLPLIVVEPFVVIQNVVVGHEMDE